MAPGCQRRDKIQVPPRELVLNSQKQITHNQLSSSQEPSFLLCLNCKCHKIKFKVSEKGYSAGSLTGSQPPEPTLFCTLHGKELH